MKTLNADILSQVTALEAILRKNPMIRQILHKASRSELPQWYLGAGCVAQTVWNYLVGRELTENISDYDLAYFDPDDTSEEAENQHAECVRKLFGELSLELDVKNQARVHLWYKDRFGYPIEPYQSVEEAINTWPTTATCIGVRYDQKVFKVYAPYGLNDLFGLVVRPNKLQINEDIYNTKVRRWKECWPELEIIPW